MNRRSFLLSLAGAGIGAAALSPLGAMAAASAQSSHAAKTSAAKGLPRLKTAQVGEGVLSLAYHSAGPEEGRPVVLLHDFAYDIHSYAEVIPLLTAQGFHVIVPALAVHAKSHSLSGDHRQDCSTNPWPIWPFVRRSITPSASNSHRPFGDSAESLALLGRATRISAIGPIRVVGTSGPVVLARRRVHGPAIPHSS